MCQVSVIIPVYNSEKYITRCLDSVINQKKAPSIEIIIIDDGSTDSTPNILQEYKKKYRFIKVLTQKNQKQSVARNNGLSAASGKYILFVDSDDYLDATMISSMYNAIELEKTDLCVCGIEKIFNNRTEQEITCCFEKSERIIADYLTKQREMDVGLWNKLFKRSLIEEHHLAFENGNFFEDTLFVFKYLCNISQNISFIERPLYHLVKREESTTTSFSPEIEEYSLKLIAKTRAYLHEKELDEYERYISIFETRCLIHIIHHHIKYNNQNKVEKMRELLSKLDNKSIGYLPLKYKLAVIFLKINPMMYSKVYRQKI